MDINWAIAFPLGIIALFFFVLGLRRGARFYDEMQLDQRQRLRDILLSSFDICAMVLSIFLAVAPPKMWPIVVPFGLAAFLAITPFLMLINYVRLYKRYHFDPQKAALQANLGNPGGKSAGTIDWYELIPFVFVIGWVIYFLVSMVVLFAGWLLGISRSL